MDHKYFKDKISAYHDAGLNLEEQELLRQHIAECEECAAALAELEAFDRMVEQQSSFNTDEYFEQNARKIEQALGFGKPEQVTDIRPEKRSGLWWKMTAAAASVAVLAFIALHEEEITEPMTSPQESVRQTIEGEAQPKSAPSAATESADELVPAEDVELRTIPPDQPTREVDLDARIDEVQPEPKRVAEPAPLRTNEQAFESSEIKPQAAEALPQVQRAVPPPAAVGEVAEERQQLYGDETVLSGNREADAERLEFWRTRLGELASGGSGSATKTVLPQSLTDKVDSKATTKSLVEGKDRKKKETAGAAGSADVSRELLDAHYMVASLTADTTEYNQSLLFIRQVSEAGGEQADYAGKLVARLTGDAGQKSSD